MRAGSLLRRRCVLLLGWGRSIFPLGGGLRSRLLLLGRLALNVGTTVVDGTPSVDGFEDGSSDGDGLCPCPDLVALIVGMSGLLSEVTTTASVFSWARGGACTLVKCVGTFFRVFAIFRKEDGDDLELVVVIIVLET